MIASNLDVSYATFKACSIGLGVYWVQIGTAIYAVLSSGDVVLTTSIDTEADLTDFALWRVAGNESSSGDDAMARALWNPVNKERVDIRPKPFTAPTRTLSIMGYRNVVTINATTTIDISFAEEREIQAADLDVKNFTDGDYVEFYAVAPAGILGPNEVILAEWGKTVYVPPSGQRYYSSDDAKTLPAGIIVRLKYVSVATEGAAPVIYFNLRTWK